MQTADLLSSTLALIHPEVVDGLYQATPFLEMMRQFGGVDVGEHGTKIVVPVATSEHSSLTGFRTGYEQPNPAVGDVLQNMEFLPADMGMPVAISKKELLENTGDAARVKIIEARHESVMGTIFRAFNEQALAGSNLIASGVGLGTLYGHSAITSNGYLEGRTPATQANTIGGLAKSSARGLQNAYGDAAGAFSTGGAGAMVDAWRGSKNFSSKGPPDFLMAHGDAYKNYKLSMSDRERWAKAEKLDAGKLELFYNSAPVVDDDTMPTHATTEFIASFYFINCKGLKVAIWKGADFELDEFRPTVAPAAPGLAAWVYLKCQLVPYAPASLGFVGDGNAN